MSVNHFMSHNQQRTPHAAGENRPASEVPTGVSASMYRPVNGLGTSSSGYSSSQFSHNSSGSAAASLSSSSTPYDALKSNYGANHSNPSHASSLSALTSSAAPTGVATGAHVHRQIIYYSGSAGQPSSVGNGLDAREVETYKRRVHELQAELKSKDDHLKISAEHVKVQQAALHTAVQNKEKAQALIKDLQSNIAELNVLIKQRDAQVNALQSQLNQMSSKDISTNGQIAAMQQKISLLEAQLKSKIEEFKVAQDQLTKANATITSQNSKIAELKSKLDILQNDNQAIAQHIQTNSEHRANLEKMREENGRLKLQLAQIVEEAEIKSAQFTAAQLQFQSRIKMYEDQLGDQGSLVAQMRKMEMEIATMAKTEEQLKSKLKKTQSELQTLANRVKEDAKKFESSEEALKDIRKQLEDSQKKNDILQNQSDELTESLNSERNALQKALSQNQSLQESKSLAEAQLKLLEEQLQNSQESGKRLELELVELRTRQPFEVKLAELEAQMQSIPENVLHYARKYRAAATLAALRKAKGDKMAGNNDAIVKDILSNEPDPESRISQLEQICSLEMDLGVYPVEQDSPLWLRMELRKVFYEEFENFSSELKKEMVLNRKETSLTKEAVNLIPESIERLAFNDRMLESVKGAVASVKDTVTQKIQGIHEGIQAHVVEPLVQQISGVKAVTHSGNAQTLDKLAELRTAIDRSENNNAVMNAIEDSKKSAAVATNLAKEEVVAELSRAFKIEENQRRTTDARFEETLRSLHTVANETFAQTSSAVRNTEVVAQGISRIEPAVAQLDIAANKLSEQVSESSRQAASRHDEAIRAVGDVRKDIGIKTEAILSRTQQASVETTTAVLHALDELATTIANRANEAKANLDAFEQRSIAARGVSQQKRDALIVEAQKQLQDELATWRLERAEEHKRVLERERASEASRAQLLQTIKTALVSAMDENAETVINEIRVVGETTKHLPASMSESLRIVSMLSEEIAKLSASEVEFLANNAAKLANDMRDMYLTTENSTRKQLTQLASETGNSLSAISSSLQTLGQDLAESFRGVNRSIQGASTEHRTSLDSSAARIQATFSNTVSELRQNIRALSQSLDEVMSSLAGALPQTLAQSLRAALAEEHRPVVDGIARVDRAVSSTSQNVAAAVAAGLSPVLQGFEAKIELLSSGWKTTLETQSESDIESIRTSLSESVRTLQDDVKDAASRIKSALSSQITTLDGHVQQGDAANINALSQISSRIGKVGEVVASMSGVLEQEREVAAQSRSSIVSTLNAVQTSVTQSSADIQQNISSSTRSLPRTVSEQVERIIQSQISTTKDIVNHAVAEQFRVQDEGSLRETQAILNAIKEETSAKSFIGTTLASISQQVDARGRESIEETRRQHAQLHTQLHQALDTLGARIAGIETCKTAIQDLRDSITTSLATIGPQAATSLLRSVDTLFAAIGTRQEELKQGVTQSQEALRNVSSMLQEIVQGGRLPAVQYQQMANALAEHGASLTQISSMVQEATRATSDTYKICDKTATQLAKLASDHSQGMSQLPDKRALKELLNESQQTVRALCSDVRSTMETTSASLAETRGALAQIDAAQHQNAALVRSDVADTSKSVTDRANEIATVIHEWSDAVRKRVDDQSLQTTRTLQSIITQVGDIATRLSDLTTLRQGQVELRAAIRESDSDVKNHVATVKSEVVASLLEQQTSVRRIEKHILEGTTRDSTTTHEVLRDISVRLGLLQRNFETILSNGAIGSGGVGGEQFDAILLAIDSMPKSEDIQNGFAEILRQLAIELTHLKESGVTSGNVSVQVETLLQQIVTPMNNMDNDLHSLRNTIEGVDQGVAKLLSGVETVQQAHTSTAEVLKEVKIGQAELISTQDRLSKADLKFKSELREAITDLMIGLRQIRAVAADIRSNMSNINSTSSGSTQQGGNGPSGSDNSGLISQLTLQVSDLNLAIQKVNTMVSVLSHNREEMMNSLHTLANTPNAVSEIRLLVQNVLSASEATNAITTEQLQKLESVSRQTAELGQKLPISTGALSEDLKGSLVPLAMTLRSVIERLDSIHSQNRSGGSPL